MRIHRGYLFWGIFFVTLGAVVLAARLDLIDADRLTDGWRLWPLVLIGIGVAILVARSRIAVMGVVAAAVVFGGLAGAGLTSGNWLFGLGDCTDADRADMQSISHFGTFEAPASVDLRLNCGTVDLSTTSGRDWRLDAAYRSEPPVVSPAPASLRVDPPSGGARRQEWNVTVPRDLIRGVSLNANAATATLNLGGAHLATVDLEANAGDLRVLADETTIDNLQVQLNAGRARLTLGGAVDGLLQANAGSIEVCVPPTADLRIDVQEQLAFEVSINGAGLTHSGNTWQRAGSGGPTIRLRVQGNAASFKLDPPGGC